MDLHKVWVSEAKIKGNTDEGPTVKWLLEQPCPHDLADLLELGAHIVNAYEVLVSSHPLEEVGDMVEDLMHVECGGCCCVRWWIIRSCNCDACDCILGA